MAIRTISFLYLRGLFVGFHRLKLYPHLFLLPSFKSSLFFTFCHLRPVQSILSHFPQVLEVYIWIRNDPYNCSRAYNFCITASYFCLWRDNAIYSQWAEQILTVYERKGSICEKSNWILQGSFCLFCFSSADPTETATFRARYLNTRKSTKLEDGRESQQNN